MQTAEATAKGSQAGSDQQARPGQELCKEGVWAHKKVSTQSLAEVVVGNALNLCMRQSSGGVQPLRPPGTVPALKVHSTCQLLYFMPSCRATMSSQVTLLKPRQLCFQALRPSLPILWDSTVTSGVAQGPTVLQETISRQSPI